MADGATVPRQALAVGDDPGFHAAITDACAWVLGRWTVTAVASPGAALARLRDDPAAHDLALVDMDRSDLAAAVLIRQIKAVAPEMPVLALTTQLRDPRTLEVLQSGATGCVVRDDPVIDLPAAIDAALAHTVPISPTLADGVLRQIPLMPPPPDELHTLTERECTLLQHLADGLSYRAAADAMGVKVSTTYSHSRAIFAKLDVNSRTQAIRLARKFGLVR